MPSRHGYRTKSFVLAITTVLALTCLFNPSSAKTVHVAIPESVQRSPNQPPDAPMLGTLEIASANGLSDGVVVLLHGTLAHHKMEIIETLQALLSEREINSLAISLSLGAPQRNGMYDCAADHYHLLQDASVELEAWRQWLQAQGSGPINLVGHSRGANQAARYALQHPKALHALTLIAPSVFDAKRFARAYEQRSGVKLQSLLTQAQQVAPSELLTGIRFLHCDQSNVSAQSFISYYHDDGLMDTPALLPKLSLPTLVIAGSADKVVEGLEQRVQPHVDDNTSLLVIEDADHFFRDLFADDIADAIAELVAD